MTEGDCHRLEVGEIPLLKDIRCIIKGTKNVAESSDDKRLNRSPLGIAMNINLDLTTHLKNSDRYIIKKKRIHIQYVAFIFMHVWTYTYELSWYCTLGEIRVPHWNTPMALDCEKDKWKTKKKPSWKPNTEKRWKVLEKKSSGLLAYSNRPWDLNLKKQKFTAQPEPILVNPQNLGAKEVSHQLCISNLLN
jgi:hypothetical protein